MATNIKKDSPEKKEEAGGMNFLQTILKEIAEFKGWEFIWQGALYGFVIWAIYNLKIVYDFHMSPEWAHIPKYPISEFKLAIVFVAFFLGYKTACQYLFFNLIKNRLDPVKFPNEEDKNLRSKAAANWLGNIIYYTCSTLTCFFLFKDQDFFPPSLGGKGDHIQMFVTVPYPKNVPYGTTFYMVQFGCHLYTLIDYCVYKWNTPKFWEMFLHHSMAVFLMFFSYLTANVPIGIMVLFTHDPCDIFLCTSRLLECLKVQYQPKILKYSNYVLFIFSWVFFRLYAFPKYIVGGGLLYYMDRDYGILNSPFLFLLLMMAALVILHAYWFVFILRILVAMVSGKKNYNLYDPKSKKVEKST